MTHRGDDQDTLPIEVQLDYYYHLLKFQLTPTRFAVVIGQSPDYNSNRIKSFEREVGLQGTTRSTNVYVIMYACMHVCM